MKLIFEPFQVQSLLCYLKSYKFSFASILNYLSCQFEFEYGLHLLLTNRTNHNLAPRVKKTLLKYISFLIVMCQIRFLIFMYHTCVNCPVNFRIRRKSILIKVLNKLILQYYLLIWLLSRISEMIFPNGWTG